MLAGRALEKILSRLKKPEAQAPRAAPHAWRYFVDGFEYFVSQSFTPLRDIIFGSSFCGWVVWFKIGSLSLCEAIYLLIPSSSNGLQNLGNSDRWLIVAF